MRGKGVFQNAGSRLKTFRGGWREEGHPYARGAPAPQGVGIPSGRTRIIPFKRRQRRGSSPAS